MRTAAGPKRDRNLIVLARQRDDGRVGFSWLCHDAMTQQQALADLRGRFPLRSELRFDALMREWTVPIAAEPRLRAWADRWATRQEWDDSPHTGRQDRATAHQTPLDAAMRAAYARLHLLPSAPPELVTAAYRALATLHHPDAGGDTQAMTAINAAIATLRTRRTA